jgi:hypothetical protein
VTVQTYRHRAPKAQAAQITADNLDEVAGLLLLSGPPELETDEDGAACFTWVAPDDPSGTPQRVYLGWWAVAPAWSSPAVLRPEEFADSWTPST